MGQIETFDAMVDLIEPTEMAGMSDHEIIQAWQETHGLEPDGDLNRLTTRLIEAPRFCGVKDRLSINGKLCRWDHAKWDGQKFTTDPPQPCVLTYFVNGSSTKMTTQQTNQGIAEAASSFPKVCAFSLVQVNAPEKANLLIDFGAIDGDSQTLAWCELPCGRDTPQTKLKMLVDTAEPWVIAIKPPAGHVDFVRVIRHELGHFAGMDHIADGNLLAPYYSPAIRDFQPGDVKELQTRYGSAIAIPVPAPTPVPGETADCTVRLPNGQVWNGPLTSTAA